MLDSERLWEAAQQQTMAYFGHRWTAEDQEHSIGGPIERVVAHIATRAGGDEGHVARILISEIEHKVATVPAHWMPGARELMQAAAGAGTPTAIVSNSWRVLVDLLVLNMDVHPDVTVSSTEVERPKPDPQPFLMACQMLHADPVRTWVIEDSPTGVAAGVAAGCWVLAVGPAVAGLTGPRVWSVDSLECIDLASLGSDGVQNP